MVVVGNSDDDEFSIGSDSFGSASVERKNPVSLEVTDRVTYQNVESLSVDARGGQADFTVADLGVGAGKIVFSDDGLAKGGIYCVIEKKEQEKAKKERKRGEN